MTLITTNKYSLDVGNSDSKTQRVVIASNQVTLPVQIQSGSNVGISGTLPSFAATPTFNIGAIGTIATESTLSGLNTKIPSGLTVSSTRLLIDGSGVTQPVSLNALPSLATGSNTIGSLNNISGIISLPTGAATSANQSTAITSLQLLDDVIATDKSTALTKLSQVGGVDVFGLAHNFATTNAGELQVVQANGATDMFGTQRVGSQYNQIDIQFYRSSVVSDLVNVVTPTGTGTVNIVDGGLVLETGTGANGFQRVNSYNTTTYRSGSELYCYFTLMATATTNVNSYQRIIFGDVNNGFGIGYNGTTFGVFSRYKTADTHYTISQFNLDKLDGSANSLFTRAGVPEAIDPTKLNVFRIRFGWVGGAPDLFEVLSPDGRWIAFHILRHPNFYTRASLPNADLPITAEVSKVSGDATNLKLTTFCWGAGITGDPMVKGLTPVTVQVTNSVQTIKSGGGLLYGYQIYNPGNNTAYVHLYDTGAAITIGTTTSKFSLGNGTLDNIPVMFPAPIVFNNSIKIGASTAVNNSNAPNQAQNVTLFYQ